MSKQEKDKVYKSKHVSKGGSLYEMIYKPKEEKTEWVTYSSENEDFVYKRRIETENKIILPYPASKDLIKNETVLFPSKAEKYSNTEDLIEEIEGFVHTYLEVSDFFESLIPHYVLFTWMYDKFQEVPYMRAIGDYSSGKSRFLKTVGSISYKPMKTMGATTPAPIFRIISQFNGTLIMDEADMRYSDEKNELVKILNNGFQKGDGVLRCTGDNHEVKSFDVFGPKIVATREKFNDNALESRFLIEEMEGNLTRNDIPLNLTDEFHKKARSIRNKCLAWRLQKFIDFEPQIKSPNLDIEPRLKQIVTPLLNIIDDSEVKQGLKEFIKDYDRTLKKERSFAFEVPILEIIINAFEKGNSKITMGEIAKKYNQKEDTAGEKDLSARKVGSIIRNSLGLETERTSSGFIVEPNTFEDQKENLKEKYGLKEDEEMNEVNDQEDERSDFKKELEDDLGFQDVPF